MRNMSTEQLHDLAKGVLTAKQYDVFRLWAAGHGTARIGLMLDLSQSTVRVQLRRAQQLVKLELEKEGHGAPTT